MFANLKKNHIALLVLLSLLIGIQLIPAKIHGSEPGMAFTGTPELEAVLRRACYDCHSAEYRLPWYGKVAPVSWWIADHISEGRKRIDFSRWDHIGWEEHTKGQIYLSIERGDMPTHSYLWMHPEAELTPEDVAMIRAWARPYEAK